MIQGLYAAATGMMTVEDRYAVIANNIANASTVGFKRQDTVQRGFYEVYLGALRRPARFNVERAPGGGVRIEQTFTDLGNGVVTQTGDPLNIALTGPGYMAVDTPYGERFTRSGALAVDLNGQLATQDGFTVQSVNGSPINVSGGPLEIDAQGRVKVAGTPAGQIRLIEFEDPHMLTREGHTLYAGRLVQDQSGRDGDDRGRLSADARHNHSDGL